MFKAPEVLPSRSSTHFKPADPLGFTRSNAERPSRESPEKDHTVSEGPPGRKGRQAEDDVAPPRDEVPAGQVVHEPDER